MALSTLQRGRLRTASAVFGKNSLFAVERVNDPLGRGSAGEWETRGRSARPRFFRRPCISSEPVDYRRVGIGADERISPGAPGWRAGRCRDHIRRLTRSRPRAELCRHAAAARHATITTSPVRAVLARRRGALRAQGAGLTAAATMPTCTCPTVNTRAVRGGRRVLRATGGRPSSVAADREVMGRQLPPVAYRPQHPPQRSAPPGGLLSPC